MYIIDRFEGELAVIEHGEDFLNIPRSELPADAEEGSVLAKTEQGWVRDPEAEAARRAAIAERRRRLGRN